MKIIAVTILVLSILISGCVGVNGEPIEIPDGQEMYMDGFLDGCMTSIFVLTSQQYLPTYDEALAICEDIRRAATEGDWSMPSQMNTPIPEQEPVIICEGNCI